jgi:hypothetical protein
MLDLAPQTLKQTQPAQRWRNYYRVYHVLHLGRLGTVFPGIHPGPDAFASQRIAESHAEALLKLINPPGRFLMDHVAAFPEGDSAN